MRKGNIIVLSILSVLFLIIWLSCNPFQGNANNGMNNLSELTDADFVRGTVNVTSFSALQTAVANSASGDVITCSFNTVACSSQLKLTKLNANVTITAGAGYTPVLDFASFSGSGDSGSGISITGSYYTLSWITVCNAGGKGILLKGGGSNQASYNTFVNVTSHDNGDSGFYIGVGSKSHTQDNTQSAYNTFTNCDSYMNYDPDGSTGAGGNADGFSPKLDPGPGNKFITCRAWYNSDDGWDQYSSFNPSTIDGCWTWHNGDRTKYGYSGSSWGGNGQGFKVGGGSAKHLIQNSVAAYHMYGLLDGSSNVKGFDQNSDVAPVDLLNNVSFKNHTNYGWWNTSGQVTISGNYGFDFVTKSDGLVGQNAYIACPYDGTQTPATIGGTAADFIATTEAAAIAARQSNGNLPNTGFGKHL